MSAAKLMHRIQNHKHVRGTSIQTFRQGRCTDEIGTPEEYCWEVRAVVYRPSRGNEINLVSRHEDLALAIIDLYYQIEFPEYDGGLLT